MYLSIRPKRTGGAPPEPARPGSVSRTRNPGPRGAGAVWSSRGITRHATRESLRAVGLDEGVDVGAEEADASAAESDGCQLAGAHQVVEGGAADAEQLQYLLGGEEVVAGGGLGDRRGAHILKT